MTETPNATLQAVTPDASRFKKRTAALFYIYAALCAVVLARIAYLATFQRQRRAELINAAFCSHDMVIPGIRGKIIASDGQTLAWSERRLNVVWHVPKNYNVAEVNWRELSAFSWAAVPAFERLQSLPGQDVLVAQNLQFDDPLLWENLLAMPELEPKVFFKRWRNHQHPESRYLGETITAPVSGLELGTSGLENLYDPQLRAGTSTCRFLKGQRNVITEGTPINGSNVILPKAYFPLP